MKRLFPSLFSAFLVAVLLAMSTVPAAMATLAYQFSGTKTGKAEHFTAYITATVNDTTDPVNGKVIDNRDGSVQSVSAMVNETASAGTSPTLNLILQGSNDGANWFGILSADGTPVAISSGATSISSAAVFGWDSAQELRGGGGFPAFLRLQADLGGTTPGWTGTVSVLVLRK